MNTEQEITVRLNASGEVDTAYYIAQAKQQRSEWFADALTGLGKVFKKMLRSAHSNRLKVPAYTY